MNRQTFCDECGRPQFLPVLSSPGSHSKPFRENAILRASHSSQVHLVSRKSRFYLTMKSCYYGKRDADAAEETY